MTTSMMFSFPYLIAAMIGGACLGIALFYTRASRTARKRLGFAFMHAVFKAADDVVEAAEDELLDRVRKIETPSREYIEAMGRLEKESAEIVRNLPIEQLLVSDEEMKVPSPDLDRKLLLGSAVRAMRETLESVRQKRAVQEEKERDAAADAAIDGMPPEIQAMLVTAARKARNAARRNPR